MFKRIVRQVALSHGVYATFMAKPMEHQPGSAMHLHISWSTTARRANLFADDDGADSAMFRHFIGGLQSYLPRVAPLFAPNVNSFRRMRPSHSAPINVAVGPRQPLVRPARADLRPPPTGGSRIRLPGADANPYLAMAAALICGWLGIEEAVEPTRAGDAATPITTPRTLPRTLEEALERFARLRAGARPAGRAASSRAFVAIKEAELEAFQGVISSWERDHLLLKV